MILSTATVRANNCILIKKTIQLLESATKAEVSKRTGLCFATCSNLINQMVAQGELLLLNTDPGPDAGRPSGHYAINPEHTHILCLFPEKLGPQLQIRYAVVNLFGKAVLTGAKEVPDICYAGLKELINQILSADPKIRTLGISIQGVVSSDGKILSCDYHQLIGIHLKKDLENAFSLQVICENDMNLLAYGLVRDESLCVRDSIASMAYYSCVPSGAGLVVDGHIIHGSTNFAGEISHLGRDLPFADQLLQHLCSVIVMINPSVIVLVGDRITAALLQEMEDLLKKRIPHSHIPKLLYLTDGFPYACQGLITRCLEVCT